MANEQANIPKAQRESPQQEFPAGERLRGLQLLSGHGAFPHGSTSLMVGEHLSAMEASGIVRAIIATADGNARVGLNRPDRPGDPLQWFIYCGPFFGRVLEKERDK